jgi:hypothetical protein
MLAYVLLNPLSPALSRRERGITKKGNYYE